jgi:hypothetical protein
VRGWIEYLPDALVVAGLTAFLVDETDAATSAFRSTTAVGLMVATAAAWLAARVVLPRLVRSAAARATLFTVAGAGVLAVVVLPAYDDETVVEVFPAAALPSTGDGASSSTSAAPNTTTTTTTPVPVRSGALAGIDHRASGTVNLYLTGDRWVVGLEAIDIQPGPDYDVYVVPGADQEDLADGYIRLDDLRGNRGTQFYEVPVGVDLATGGWTVLVWCETFDVPIAASSPA